MEWRDDWPVIGEDPDGDGKGQPVLVHRKPEAAVQASVASPCSDEFKAAGLGLEWQWQANPQAGWLSPPGTSGMLRLAAAPAPPGPNLWLAPNLLMQKFPAPAFTVTTRLEFAPRAEDERAGLIVFGYSYAWIGLRQKPRGLRLVLAICENANEGEVEKEVAGLDLPRATVHLRMSVDAHARCRFAYGFDGLAFEALGCEFQARQSRWVGAKVGLFAVCRTDAAQTGYAEFGGFRIASVL
jgi:beta-xylosidase